MEAEAENNDLKKEENNNDNNNNNNESNRKIGNSSECLSKPKHQMKMPFQLETLEKAYASLLLLTFFFLVQFLGFFIVHFFIVQIFCFWFLVENYPSETMRVELSEKLGLSDR